MESIAASIGMSVSEFVMYWIVVGTGIGSAIVWAYTEWKGY